MVEEVEFVIAGYDYEAKESHELSIRKGDRLRLISDQHNWWKVVNDRGHVGFVPSNFVTRKPQSLANRAKETFKALGRSRSKNSLDIEPLQQAVNFSKLNTTEDIQQQLPSLPTSILKKAKSGTGIKLRANEMPDAISYAIAKFNYDPQREDELRLAKGDQLSILDKSADGWWRVLNSDGSSGWIPSNYVDETNSAPAPPAQNFSNEPSNIPAESYNYNNGMANLSMQPTSFSNAPSSQVLEVVVALYSFDAQNSEELSFRKGEQLDVIDHPAHDPDWYKARNARGDIGLIPTNYIEIVDRNPPSTTFSNVPVLTGPYANEPWYYGRLSREQSDGLLNSQGIEGDYLVRDSESNPGDYSISLKGNLRNKHFWVQVTNDGSYKIGNRTFPTIHQLIQHYTKSPIFSNDSTNERLYLVKPLPR